MAEDKKDEKTQDAGEAAATTIGDGSGAAVAAEKKVVQKVTPEYEAQQAENILKRVQTNPSLLEDPTIKEYYDKAKELAAKNAEGGEGTKVTGDKGKEDGKGGGDDKSKDDDKGRGDDKDKGGEGDGKIATEGGDKKDDKSTDDKGEGDDKDKDDVSIFLAKGKKAPEIKDINELKEFISKNHSIDDVQTFLNSVTKWRTDSNKTAESEKAYDDLRTFIANLPAGLYNAIEAHGQGMDWERALDDVGGRIDYSLSFANQDAWKILSKYYGDSVEELQNKFSAGDITEEDFDSRVQTLFSSAEPLYQKDQQNWNNQRDELLTGQQKVQENFKKSVTVSVDNLKNDIPGFSSEKHKSKLDAVRNILAGNQIVELFYTKEGVLREDAAKRLFYAKYGEEETERLVKVAKQQGKSEATEQYVDKNTKKSPDAGSKDKKQPDQSAVNAQKEVVDRYLKHTAPSKNPLEHVPKV